MKRKTLLLQLKRYYFPLILLLFFIYSSLLIYRSSFVINNVRYFSLFDDAMISMRYGYNMAQGNGLVWNPGGEHIEGFTNPLWTLYMACIHLAPISLSKTSLLIQITNIFCLAFTLYFVKKIITLFDSKSLFLQVVSLLFIAFYFPLNNWSTILGMEVGVLSLLVTWCVYLTLLTCKKYTFSYLLFFLLGIGTLVRIDFIIPAIIITMFLLIVDKKNRKKYLAIGIPMLVMFLSIQTIVRLWYYNDIFPNTYYLKMTGYPVLLRITRGIYVGIRSMNWVLVSIPFLFAYFTKDKRFYLILAIFIAQLFYSAYVGGDAWEHFGGANRYVAIVMPIFFVSFVFTFYKLRTYTKSHFPKKFHTYTLAELAVLFFCFIMFNSGSDNTLLQLTLLKSPLTVGENAFQVRMAQSLTDVTKPDAKIGIVWAGATPYHTRRYFIDLLGKNEKVIAHKAANDYGMDSNGLRKYTSFWPGHTKWDYAYVVKHYKPDIFGQVYPDEGKMHLQNDYTRKLSKEGYEYFVRKGTKLVTID